MRDLTPSTARPSLAAPPLTLFTMVALAASLTGSVPRAVASDLGPPHFTDVTLAAGVAYLQQAGNVPPNCIFGSGSLCEQERMTGGAAVGDIDADGLPDLFVTRLDASDILFRNRGDGTFEDVSAIYGLDSYVLQSNGALFFDMDNDGDLDLYVTVMGDNGDEPNTRNYLFRNQGPGLPLVEEAEMRGASLATDFDLSAYSTTAGDFDRDGWLDLHVTEWPPTFPSNAVLLHNQGPIAPGHFVDVTAAAGVSLGSVYAFASTLTDLDGDGWPDLAVAGDFGTSRLFWNNGDGTFVDGTAAAGVGTDENGMGSTFGDFDADGDLDWFVTSIWDPFETCETNPCNWEYSGNRLYRYEGNRTFSDATDEAGVRKGGWGWGAVFFDSDNDSDLDLVMTNGVDFPTSDVDSVFNDEPMRFWVNDGTGAMTERSTAAGLTDTGSGKGMLTFDYDLDGDLDVFLTNNAQPPRLYRNDGGNAGDWLRVQTIGTLSNAAGLGAKIGLQATPGAPRQVREMGTASHFLGQSELVAHFGLGVGVEPVGRLRVVWPSGLEDRLVELPRNSTVVVVEGVGSCVLPGSRLLSRVDALTATDLDGDGDGLCDLPGTRPGARPGTRPGR